MAIETRIYESTALNHCGTAQVTTRTYELPDCVVVERVFPTTGKIEYRHSNTPNGTRLLLSWQAEGTPETVRVPERVASLVQNSVTSRLPCSVAGPVLRSALRAVHYLAERDR